MNNVYEVYVTNSEGTSTHVKLETQGEGQINLETLMMAMQGKMDLETLMMAMIMFETLDESEEKQ